MVIKTSVCVALACAGLGPVAAGLVFHAKHATPVVAVSIKQTSPWGTLSDAGVSSGDTAPTNDASAILPKHLALAPEGLVQATTETDVSDVTQTRTVDQIPTAPDLVGAPASDTQPAETSPAPVLREAAISPDVQTTTSPPVNGDASGTAQDSSATHVRPGMLFDINTASMAELNRIPGMSNIGRAIVTHRPYKTVEDLVSHRVLRSSDFQRVKDKVKV